MAFQNDSSEWKTKMEVVPSRIPLSEVAIWWVDIWEWRTAELNAGRGNPYDYHPSYRAPWSLVVSKYPWITVDDRIDLSPLVESEMKARSKNNPDMKQWYKDYLKEKREFNSR